MKTSKRLTRKIELRTLGMFRRKIERPQLAIPPAHQSPCQNFLFFAELAKTPTESLIELHDHGLLTLVSN